MNDELTFYCVKIVDGHESLQGTYVHLCDIVNGNGIRIADHMMHAAKIDKLEEAKHFVSICERNADEFVRSFEIVKVSLTYTEMPVSEEEAP